MAGSVLLRLGVALSAFVVSQSMTSLSNTDYVTSAKLLREQLEHNLRPNRSKELTENDLQVQTLEASILVPLEEGNLDELPQGERAVFTLGQKPAENTKPYLEYKSGVLPSKEDKTVLVAYDNVGQTRSETTERTGLEESWTAQHRRVMHPGESNSLGLSSKANHLILMQKEEGTKRKSTEKLPKSLQMDNYVEPEHAQESTAQILSTVHPTVSTITLVTSAQPHFNAGDDGPYTQIQKLQIDSGNEQVSETVLKNSVGVQGDLDHTPPHIPSEGPRQALQDNFLDDNLIPKVYNMQSSEKYHAAYRTTESYLAAHGLGPDRNEVISADVEIIHTDDNLQYQKDGNSIPEESVTAENDTAALNISTSTQEKQKTVAQVPSSTGISIQFLPSSPSLSQDLSTLWPYHSKTNLPYAAADNNKDLTLEAKSRTQTERLSPAPTVQKSFGMENGSEKLQDLAKSSAEPGKGSTVTTLKSPAVGSASPALAMSTTWQMPLTKPQENAPDINPFQTGVIGTPQAVPNGTKRMGRRGEIRVTTQRALHRPQPVDVPTNLPSKRPTLDTLLCSNTGGQCEFLGSNRTLLKWDDLQRTLSFAWDMHVYGTAVLFLLLSVIAMINLIGSPVLRVSYLPYILGSNVLLFTIGVLRAVYFLLDPYGSKATISHAIALVLYNITFPLILSTFATLVLLVLKIARLQLLPPKIQSLPLLGVVGVIHFIVLLSADLLAHLLNPSVNIVLQVLSISWGIFLMVGTFVAYFRLRKTNKDIVSETQRVSPTTEDIVVVQTQGRNLKCLFTSSRVLLVSSIFGLLCCGLQGYAVLWLYGLLGNSDEFSWSWWFLQFWFRIFELALCFSMLFVASHSFCVQCSSNDHTCWSKIISYFCTYKKTEVPEYPNNCYDWTNSIQDRIVNNNINKSLIRNQPENMPLRILKENNETKSSAGFSNNSRSSSPLFRPKPESVYGPKSQNVTMGRSYTSICFEKESMLSLTDLEFRPPSPINLSRSIDEALFREHLVRDSIFLDSSLQYPSYLTRQDSCSSLKECSVLNQTVDPLISSDLKMRRCSNPDYMYALARCNSVTDVDTPTESPQESKELPPDIATEGIVSVSSLDSVSKGSIKISWNPWKHGLPSVESLPLEDTPDSQLLQQGSQPSITSKSTEPEKTFGKRLIERSQTTDSHSIASDTIEL
ncbi:proline-rich transmembrane protein 3 [Pelodytes ibericus]